MARQPSLIALDWGSSSLRAQLLNDCGAVLDSRSEPWGILRVPNGDFATVFRAVTDPWRARWSGLKVIAAGMVGSANGWTEVRYCSAPAGVEELVAGLGCVAETCHIVPGVMQSGDHPDVMRGEETQIVGTLSLHPQLSANSVLILPGTHSKWVHIANGKISEFTTYMTGELFAVLRDHSILGRLAEADEPCAAGSDAFARGVDVARHSPRGLAPILFSARAAVLANEMSARDVSSYLSGLLIGDECCAALGQGARPSALIGDAAVCRFYQRALGLLGVSEIPILADAASAGLWHLARKAGLVA